MKKVLHKVKIKQITIVILFSLILLISLRYYYQLPTKNEVIYFEYTNTDNPTLKDNGLEVTLTSKNLVTLETDNRIYLSGAQGFIYPASRYTFHDKSFYFIGKDGGLTKVNSDLYTINNSILTLQKGDYISDYFIRDNFIYYLVGPFCNEYMGKCNNSIMAFNVLTKKSEKLTTNIQENTISGFSRDGKKLILSNGSGDAGCAWEKFTTFDLITNTITDTKDFVWCIEEKETEETLKKRKEFTENIYPKTTNVKYISYINNNLISTGEDATIIHLITPKDPASSIESIRVY